MAFTVERSDGSESLYVCARATGTRKRLANAGRRGARFSQVRVARQYLAFQWATGTTRSIKRFDVGTNRMRTWTRARAGSGSLRLAIHGPVVWVEQGAFGNEVRVGDASGHRAIDSGAIDPKSLKVVGLNAIWNNAGRERSLTLPDSL